MTKIQYSNEGISTIWYAINYCNPKTWANSSQSTISFLSNDSLSRIAAMESFAPLTIFRKRMNLASTILVTLFNDWVIQSIQYSRAIILYTVLLDMAKHSVDVSRRSTFKLFIFPNRSVICPMVWAYASSSLLLKKWWMASRWSRSFFHTLYVKRISLPWLSPRAISTWLGVEILIPISKYL